MEEVVKPDEEQPKAEQQLRLDETGADTAYSNFFLISTGVEEFFLNFGMRTSDPPHPQPTPWRPHPLKRAFRQVTVAFGAKSVESL